MIIILWKYLSNITKIFSLLLGKCSHGGFFDRTSRRDPVGGINKDDVGSSHGLLHHKAADLAVNATMELLQDIRIAVGDKNFLRYGSPYYYLTNWAFYVASTVQEE